MSRAERLNQDDYFHAAVIYAGATYHLVAERDQEQDEEDDEEEGADAKPLYAYIVSVFHEATGTTRREVCFSGEERGVEAIDWLIEQSQENGVFADIARVVAASPGMLATLKAISAGDVMKATHGTWTHADTVLKYQAMAAHAIAAAEGAA